MAYNRPPVPLDNADNAARWLLFFLLGQGLGGSNGLGLLAYHIIVLLVFVRVRVVVFECG
jgi:hypothetical protein